MAGAVSKGGALRGKNTFLQLKQEREQRAEDKHKRKMLALSIREGGSGTDRHCKHPKRETCFTQDERKAAEAEYRQDKQIQPEFRLELILDIVE